MATAGDGRRCRMTPVNILHRLRKQKIRVVAVVLPLLATAWFGASASACIGMGVGQLDVPPTVERGEHDHSGGHDHLAQSDRSVHGSIGYPGGEAPQSENAPSHSHGNCPHCPLPAGGAVPLATNHVVCSVLDEGSETAVQPSALQWDLLKSAPLHPPIYVAPVYLQRSPLPSQLVAVPAERSIAINLRHCVFLI